jgi:hypothetical protein
MQQLDEFFKEQNEKFIIETSLQKEHWKQLQINQPKKRAAFFALLVGIYWLVQNNKSSTPLSENVSTTTPKTSNEANTNITELHTTNNNVTSNIEPKTNTTTPTETKKPSLINKELETKIVNPKTINKEAQFYIDLSKEPELFSIDPTINNTITCKQGSVISIPANSIVGKNETAMQENVTVIVQEYYRYEGQDNNGKIQPTAGMIKYELFKEEQKLKIAIGKAVEIKMKNGLQHFKIVASDDALTQQEIAAYNWVSNEKFYSDTRIKIDYKITLNENFDAKTFMSQIAFPKYNALLPGNIENNSLLFTNVPVGEPIYFISLGKVGKKYFSCSKKLVSGTTNIKAMDFLEISEAAYHQQLEMFGKLGKGE